jgi:iron complex transport system substrate-binding protein
MRRVLALVFVAALAVGLTACAEPGATAAPPAAAEDTCPQATTPLASLDLIDDVRG